MGITTADRTARRGSAPYVVVRQLNHYTVRSGRIYRDTIVRRLADDTLRVYLIPEEATA